MSMMISPYRMAPSTPPVSYPYDFTIVNPGAEAGNTSGWTTGGHSEGVIASGTSGYPLARTGSYYFIAGTVTATLGTQYQDLTIPSGAISDVDASLLAVELTAYQNSYGGDNDAGTLTLQCLDASNSVLGSFTAFSRTDMTSWRERRAKIPVPSGTRKVRVGYQGTASVTSVIDVYFEDFSARLVTTRTSYSNSGGTGNRTGIITSSVTNIGGGGGAVSGLVNGSLDNNYWWAGATGNGTGYVKWDFGSAKIIDGFRWYQSDGSSHGTWRFEGSNDDATYTQIGSDFTLCLGDTISEYFFSNSTAYRYHRMRHMSGSRSGNPWLYEIEFQIS